MSSTTLGIQFRPNYDKHKQIFSDLQEFVDSKSLKLPMLLCKPINRCNTPNKKPGHDSAKLLQKCMTGKDISSADNIYYTSTIIRLYNLEHNFTVTPYSNQKKYYINVYLERLTYQTNEKYEQLYPNRNGMYSKKETTKIIIHKPIFPTGNYEFECYNGSNLSNFTTDQILDILDKLIIMITNITDFKLSNNFATNPEQETSKGFERLSVDSLQLQENATPPNSVSELSLPCEHIKYFFEKNPLFKPSVSTKYPTRINKIITSGEFVEYTRHRYPTKPHDVNINFGQFVILKYTNTKPYIIAKPYTIEVDDQGNLPKYNSKIHSNRMGLIVFGNKKTINIKSTNGVNTQTTNSITVPLRFIKLNEEQLRGIEIISNQLVTKNYGKYLPNKTVVNANFIQTNLDIINKNEINLAKLKKGGRTKKRFQKHTHKRRRNLKTQTKRRRM